MNHQLRMLLALKQQMRREIGFRPSYATVYEQLLHWENSQTGFTCPAQGALARACRYARETVNRACAWLEAHGYIKSQQRYRRIARNGVRFLSKRYWIAHEVDQVAHMLCHLSKRAAALLARLSNRPSPRKFSSDPKITPPSRTELNPEEIERLKTMFQLRWNE